MKLHEAIAKLKKQKNSFNQIHFDYYDSKCHPDVTHLQETEYEQAT